MTDEEILATADACGLMLFGLGLNKAKFEFCILAFAKQIAKLERYHEREALAQEPVAWVLEDVCEGQYIDGRPRKIWWECSKGVGTAFYTHPQRTWADLTPQDYAEIFRTARSVDYAARLAAAKLKEKNT